MEFPTALVRLDFFEPTTKEHAICWEWCGVYLRLSKPSCPSRRMGNPWQAMRVSLLFRNFLQDLEQEWNERQLGHLVPFLVFLKLFVQAIHVTFQLTHCWKNGITITWCLFFSWQPHLEGAKRPWSGLTFFDFHFSGWEGMNKAAVISFLSGLAVNKAKPNVCCWITPLAQLAHAKLLGCSSNHPLASSGVVGHLARAQFFLVQELEQAYL